MEMNPKSELGVEIVEKSKYKGVSPSQEMGLDIEPTATSPDVGTMSEVEPTEKPVDIGQYRPDDGGKIIYEDQKEAKRFPVDE